MISGVLICASVSGAAQQGVISDHDARSRAAGSARIGGSDAERLVELLPGVWADVSRGVVEFAGTVPIDAHDPEAPDVWLEQIVCIPDTREHESLVVTDVRPGDVHAALLASGLDPGSPGRWASEAEGLTLVAPTGPAVRVLIRAPTASGATVTRPALDWVRSAHDGRTLAERLEDEPMAQDPEAVPGFVFSGSSIGMFQGRSVYDANYSGTLIGLATFGTETIALSRVIPHREAVAPLEWLADSRVVPPRGTPVVVRLEAIGSALPEP